MAEEDPSSTGAPSHRTRRFWLGVSGMASVGTLAIWLACGTCCVRPEPEIVAQPETATMGSHRSTAAARPSSVERNPSGSAQDAEEYSPEERRTLLLLARRAVVQAARHADAPDVPDSISAHLRQKKGAFVTLTQNGQLRGCIGDIFPEDPLVEAVINNARNAALRDPRFSPVMPDELGSIEIEVSVLSVPKPLPFSSPENLLGRLRPRVHGVVLHVDGSRATFLPQVWEQLPNAVDFLNHLSAKAGRTPSAWRGSGTEVETYTAEAFEESEFGFPQRR